ncbi:Ltp family lipoprotein [Clostridium senegalense]|uniref:Ltp family lipoprotein n=1 Tax=Clostridium senegalense TaxID=1465809 RepID=UPI001C103788|nr:Ltp family lipoprotein [Clostridium senegalense]MBU5226516.1 Ltp family lipoprotein [Clostridium senegalense]
MGKMIQCKDCSKEISSSAKFCPSCGAKNKKPFYKKVWFWLFVVIIIGIMGNAVSNDSKLDTGNKQEVSQNQKTEENAPVKENAQVKEKAEDVPTEYKSALKKAKVYSDNMSMSKVGLYDQLTSEYGEKFTAEAAQYAIDNINADWNKNALNKAKIYQKDMAMSPSAIYDQLISEYGEKFTPEEAQYAIDNLE